MRRHFHFQCNLYVLASCPTACPPFITELPPPTYCRPNLSHSFLYLASSESSTPSRGQFASWCVEFDCLRLPADSVADTSLHRTHHHTIVIAIPLIAVLSNVKGSRAVKIACLDRFHHSLPLIIPPVFERWPKGPCNPSLPQFLVYTQSRSARILPISLPTHPQKSSNQHYTDSALVKPVI
jgi:hypothetical protein